MVRVSNLHGVYESIREYTSRSSSKNVKIFVSNSDCDSLCAFRILSSLFKGDSIQYSMFLVSGFHSLQQTAAKVLSDPDESSVVVMINCGGGVDVRRLLDLPPHVFCFIFDSHRPIHLSNSSFENKQVTVVLPDRQEEPEVDDHGSSDSDLSEYSSEEEDDDDIYSDEDDDLDAANDPRNRRHGPASQSRRADRDQRRAERQRRRAEREERRRNRAHGRRGGYYGKAVGRLLYGMAHTLQRNTNELLWLSIIALTDQLVHERVDTEHYLAGARELEQQVLSANLHKATDTRLEDGTVVRLPNNDLIRFDQELRFMLLRHWSLFEAMSYSSFVASRLQLWRETGRSQLKTLLARMGLPLEEARQKYTHMNAELKRTLPDKVRERANAPPEYPRGAPPKRKRDEGVVDVAGVMRDAFFQSFTRTCGYREDLSAADVVYAVTALLESWNIGAERAGNNAGGGVGGGGAAGSSNAAAPSRGGAGGSSGAGPGGAGGNGGAGSSGARAGEAERGPFACFWRACRALDDWSDELQFGLQLSMRVQAALLRTATLELEKKTAKSLSQMSYVIIENPVDGPLVVRPLALVRMGLFLMDALTHTGRGRKGRVAGNAPKLPIVVGAVEEGSDRALVVGVVPRAGVAAGDGRGGSSGALYKRFHRAFARTARDIRADFHQDAFDASVIELPRAQMENFILGIVETMK
eukprot:jgi/Mesvir1/26499/Mv16160-RA.1